MHARPVRHCIPTFLCTSFMHIYAITFVSYAIKSGITGPFGNSDNNLLGISCDRL